MTAGVFVHILVSGAIVFSKPLFDKTPYHTSILTGKGWVLELLHGHSKWIYTELRVHQHVFHHLVCALQDAGIKWSKYVLVKEKLAIFLYASVTGLLVQHLGEQFQHFNETISKWELFIYCAYWFIIIYQILLRGPFHTVITTFLHQICLSPLRHHTHPK